MPILNRGLLNSTALTNVSLIAAGLMLATAPAMAQPANTLPTGGTVIGGSSTISQSGNTLTITQATQNTAINWQSFSIGSAATTNFLQPNSSAIAVNRVTGIDPSVIEGHLNANGQVILVNPNGVLFGKGAQVNVGALVASTSGISEQNAIAGNLVFDQGSKAGAKIVNNGTISAKDGGLVALVAPSVINNGVITAKLGRVSLAAGNKWTLDLYGDKLVNFALNDKVVGEVKNTGVISADGGTVEITANVAKDVVSNSINMGGIVEASSVSQQGGTIILDGGDGNVAVTGTLAATGTTGGTVDVTGQNVILKGATINASGQAGGGTINVGGESHGGGTLAHAKSVTVDSSSRLIADAIASGNGGDITVWSDGNTNFAGSAEAKGIANGGTVETSGHVLSIDGASVNVSGKSGSNGKWLLDPYDLTIDQGGAAAIESGLANGNVLIETTASGADGTINGMMTGTTATGSIASFGTVSNGTGDINVDSAIAWSSANSLTLSAYDSINVNASITNVGTGNITLRGDNAAQGASVVAGQVSFNNGSTANTGGVVSIYYDTTNYTNPINYSGVATGTNGVATYMLVDNAADLARINTNLSGDYALGTNISAIGAFATLGNFTGVLNGNGGLAANYSLDGLVLGSVGANNVGLFAANAGTIENLDLTNVNVQGSNQVGALAGSNSGTISNVSVEGTVTGASGYDVGGLVGINTGTINGANSQTDILIANWGARVGGLVGSNFGTIIGATVGTTVEVASDATNPSSEIGGLVGYNYGIGTISNSGGVAEVFAGDNSGDVGGFVGWNDGAINGVQMAAQVSVGNYAYMEGGLVGNNYGNIANANTGVLVYAGDYIQNEGGLVGWNQGSINNSSLIGQVVAGNSGAQIGGFVGSNLAPATLTGNSVGVQVYVGTGGGNIGGFAGANGGMLTNDQVTTSYSILGTMIQASAPFSSFANLFGATLGTSIASTLNVGANGTSIGGLVGYNGGVVMSSSATNTLNLGNNEFAFGGLVGLSTGYVANNIVQDTINAGAGSGFGGGLMGFNVNSVANNIVTSTIMEGDGSGLIGGYIGQNVGTSTGGQSNESITVGGYSAAIGGFIGNNAGTINGGTATGTIVAGDNSSDIGGFAGLNQAGSSITGSYASGSMTVGFGASYIGGFVGENAGTIMGGQAGEIISVGFDGTGSSGVKGAQAVGGFAGKNDLGALITNSVYNGSITTKDGVAIGGFAGWNLIGGTIVGSTATDNILAVDDVNTSAGFPNMIRATPGGFVTNAGGGAIGGFLGFNEGTLTNDQTSISNVTVGDGAVAIGGFVGSNFGAITNATQFGSVSAGEASRYLGGFAGYNTSTISGGYTNATVNVGDGAYDVGGFVGYDAGTSLNGTAAGAVTVGNNASNIGGYVGELIYNGLVSGVSSASSVHVGDNASAVGGIAGLVDTTATVTNSTSNANVTVGQNATNVGGIVGTNNGTFANNGYTGTVSTNQNATNVGGLIGYNTGTATNSSEDGNVLTINYATNVGGAIGQNTDGATASSLTVVSNVVSGDYATAIGGIVGLNGNGGTAAASLTNSSYTGTVTVGSNGFAIGGLAGWDNTNGALSGLTGTGLVAAPAGSGTTYIHDANQVGCEEVGGNCFGVAGQEVITITPNNLTVVYGQSQNLTYGTSYAAPGGTANGLESGDIAANVYQVMLQSNQVHVGSSAITDTGTAINQSNANALLNYKIVLAPATVTVTPATVTVTPTGSQTYGGTNVAVSYSYNGLVNGDTGSVVSGLSYTTPATSSSNAGTYSITATGGSASDYTVVDSSGTFTVNKANLTVGATGSETYGGTNLLVAYSYSGLVNGDSSNAITGLSYTTTATSTSNVGLYTIVSTGGTAQNYNVSNGPAGSFSVTPASLTVAANDTTRTQGTNSPAFSANFTGLVNGDSSSVVTGLIFSPGDTSGLAQGVYNNLITISGGVAQNYVLTYVAGTLTVAPAGGGSGTNPSVVPGQVTNVTGQIAGLNSLLQTFDTTFANSTSQQATCLKVNSEVRGVTTDSPIDCAAPLQVNGF